MTPAVGLAACVFRSVEILAVARECGYDFLLADMEHGAFSLGEVATLCVAGRQADFSVFVRVPGAASEHLTRVADCGAHGVIVPHVDDVETARLIVDRLRFPPLGRRSIPSPVAASGFRPLPPRDFTERERSQPTLAVMIESVEGLAAVEEIAALAGIDIVMIGPNDLAQSLGHTGDIDHPEVRSAFRRVADAAHAHDKRYGIIGLAPEHIRVHVEELGAAFVVAGNEINLLFEACEARIAEIRGLVQA